MARFLTLERGARLGKYEVLAPLGEGGMAQVYLARTGGIEGFEKLVAVKRILPALASDDDFVQMFLDEARLAATLDHPHVAAVLDIGESDGDFFFVMEHLHGKDVRALLRAAARAGERLSLAKALTIVTRVAAGLHHAHTRRDADGRPLGIVHRDVSLSNILVTYDGAVKIVDFGVAKAMSRRSRTRTGTVKGKIQYMSPEQCRGDDVDRRSDVFALGIVLFELTTGTRLFGRKDDVAIMHQLVYGALPRPSSRVDHYPAALETVVMKALAQKPEQRFESAQALQEALENFARDAHLTLSNIELAATMRTLYGEPPDPRQTGAAPGPASPPASPDGFEATAMRDTTKLSVTIPGLRKTPRSVGAMLALVGAGAVTVWAVSSAPERTDDRDSAATAVASALKPRPVSVADVGAPAPSATARTSFRAPPPAEVRTATARAAATPVAPWPRGSKPAATPKPQPPPRSSPSPSARRSAPPREPYRDEDKLLLE
ncbi:MAG: serine/threonine-protein kinase [Myxococcota bacterium]